VCSNAVVLLAPMRGNGGHDDSVSTAISRSVAGLPISWLIEAE
jgi:hypothetical protein